MFLKQFDFSLAFDYDIKHIFEIHLKVKIIRQLSTLDIIYPISVKLYFGQVFIYFLKT